MLPSESVVTSETVSAELVVGPKYVDASNSVSSLLNFEMMPLSVRACPVNSVSKALGVVG